MIEIHRDGRAAWTCAVAPSAEERRRLTEEHGVPVEMVAHALDRDELPRLQHEGDALLVVVRVPIASTAAAGPPYRTSPLGLVLFPDRVVTVSPEDSSVLARLRRFATTESEPGAHHRLILHALEVTAETYLACVRDLDRRVDALEEELQDSLENRAVRALLQCQKSLAYFSAALGATVLMLEGLRRLPELRVPPADQPLLQETLVEVRQALEMTNLSSGILSNMMDAFASIISNNLNVVMKFLAAAAVILTFPVLIASYWGMNVPLPGQRDAASLWWIGAVSLAVSLAVAAFFRSRKWL